MNSDALASSYRFFEYAAFQGRLQKHRLHFLPFVGAAKHALVLGDGDGRFLAKLAAACPQVQIDCVELSQRMIAQSTMRLRQARVPLEGRIQFHRADARTFALPRSKYDLVISHFFLDCFTTAEVGRLCARIDAACQPEARWVISEFRQPARGWAAGHARLWLSAMYSFFRWTTKLKVDRLPAYAPALGAIGFHLESEHTSRAGLIASELWVRSNMKGTRARVV